MPSAPAPHAPLLSVDGLCFSRNEEPIFGPLHFEVDAGEALLVRGDNGAGKTTLLRVLAGLLRADSGQVRTQSSGPDVDARRRIAYLGHLPALKADLTVLQNLQFLSDLHGRRPDRSIEQALRLVGLQGHDDAPARQLSAGQKKRLSLARVWLSPAALWLLDEPYANLDLGGIDLVNALIAAHLRNGGAAMVTTHGAYATPPVRTRELVLKAREDTAA